LVFAINQFHLSVGMRWSAEVPPPECIGNMCRVPMESDNSCLFKSVDYLLCGGKEKGPGYFRRIVKTEIESDAETYSDAILDKPRKEYMDWIERPDSWGGYVELVILSKYFQIQFVVVNIETASLYTYGDEYQLRAYLTYDGIHYDCLVAKHTPSPSQAMSLCPKKIHQTGCVLKIFRSDDRVTEKKALDLGKELSKGHQYTNLASMPLICSDCKQSFQGTRNVKEHTASTGHVEFEEPKQPRISE